MRRRLVLLALCACSVSVLLVAQGRDANQLRQPSPGPEGAPVVKVVKRDYDMAALLKINTQGRLKFVDGDDQEIIPGIRAYIGGKHTHESQYVSVTIDSGTAVFTSDNIYLYENLEKHAPIAQTVDGDAGVASNLKAQDRIRTLASDPRLIVPGHEPLVFEKFQSVGEGIVRIK